MCTCQLVLCFLCLKLTLFQDIAKMSREAIQHPWATAPAEVFNTSDLQQEGAGNPADQISVCKDKSYPLIKVFRRLPVSSDSCLQVWQRLLMSSDKFARGLHLLQVNMPRGNLFAISPNNFKIIKQWATFLQHPPTTLYYKTKKKLIS
jgi:hypothetical protein